VITTVDRPAPADAGQAAHDDLDLWWASLDVPQSRVQELARTLAVDELARANRFQARLHRDRWIVGRGLLRELIGRYVGCLPRSVRLAYSAHGKPSFAGEWSNGRLRFNVSHAAGLGLFAIASDREIGVDVEAIRPLQDLQLIAEHFFSPGEQTTLRSLPAEQRVMGFFNCWSRKEAYIKALGLGLSQPLDAFDVELTPGRPARLLAIDGVAGPAASWSLEAVPAPAGFAAAVAVPGRISHITQRWLEST
jgi:4'-phosphopantetheinyl transferase